MHSTPMGILLLLIATDVARTFGLLLKVQYLQILPPGDGNKLLLFNKSHTAITTQITTQTHGCRHTGGITQVSVREYN